jgi:hypothetical protein
VGRWLVIAIVALAVGAGAAQKNKDAPGVPLVNLSGTLKRLDAHMVRLQDAEGHDLEFRRSHKTRFFQGKREISDKKFHAGDAVSVESSMLPDGSLEAVNVYLEHAAVQP